MDRNSSFIFTYVFETKVIFTWNKAEYIDTYVIIFIKRMMVFYFMFVYLYASVILFNNSLGLPFPLIKNFSSNN